MLIKLGRHAVLLGTMVLVLAVPARAQDQPDDRSFGDWLVSCEPPEGEDRQCALAQQVVAEDREGVWLNAYFFRPPESEDRLLLSVLVPLNVILTRRLGLRIDDGERMQFDFIRCSEAGCLVSIEVDDELLAAFRAGNEALFDFYFEDEEGVGVPVSLIGLTAGLEALT